MDYNTGLPRGLTHSMLTSEGIPYAFRDCQISSFPAFDYSALERRIESDKNGLVFYEAWKKDQRNSKDAACTFLKQKYFQVMYNSIEVTPVHIAVCRSLGVKLTPSLNLSTTEKYDLAMRCLRKVLVLKSLDYQLPVVKTLGVDEIYHYLDLKATILLNNLQKPKGVYANKSVLELKSMKRSWEALVKQQKKMLITDSYCLHPSTVDRKIHAPGPIRDLLDRKKREAAIANIMENPKTDPRFEGMGELVADIMRCKNMEAAIANLKENQKFSRMEGNNYPIQSICLEAINKAADECSGNKPDESSD